MTPEQWRRQNTWKYGPRKLIVSERPDPIQLEETAGDTADKNDERVARLIAAGIVLGAILLVIREVLP